ncbi:hypothetical protein AB0A74_37135 [Saccharothrix sp. NPDC042600]|nr:hypothetical protein GCM10017745_56620 [Saccharothrix mutabilis subsp. capreolus]
MPSAAPRTGSAPDTGEGVHVMENTWELVEIEESDFDVLGNKSY